MEKDALVKKMLHVMHLVGKERKTTAHMSNYNFSHALNQFCRRKITASADQLKVYFKFGFQLIRGRELFAT
ncbi:hypothetical protein A4A49_14962 [Nicotiana attenuata]|uniref:Uncharacterized protein n=1 Tax=Nicotiana attenuata TaxID=49451 RepID=A0A1J6J102_NICAT|nr:hypothetical protein A4A49_14962 [Nicotiana attenuata]